MRVRAESTAATLPREKCVRGRWCISLRVNRQLGVFNLSWYLAALQKYVSFSGRARRKEYWMFTLFNILIVIALTIAELTLLGRRDGGRSYISLIYQLAVLLPSIAVGVRRMHDTGRSGLWLMLPIANLIFLCLAGNPGENRFGPDPKQSVSIV